MIITNSTLTGLSVGFKTIFNSAFDGVTPNWDKIAMKVPSTTGSETYAWLGDIPGMREWVGEKVIQNLSTSDYTIKNKDFELTIGVKRNDLEDDQYGVYTPMVQMMGNSAARFPDGLVLPLLVGGFKNLCFDSKPFFATTHKTGKLAVSNRGTAKLSGTSYASARATMMSLKKEDGASLGIMPNLLVVPPAKEGEARKILLSDQIDGTTNVFKGTAELLVLPELAGNDEAWFLLDTTKPVKPLIYQERKPVKFINVISETDDFVFRTGEFKYGVEARGNGGYGLWQMAWGSDGTT